MMALTAINLAYYQELMAGARAAIAEGRLADYIAETSRRAGTRGESDRRLKLEHDGAKAPKKQGRELSPALLFCTLSLLGWSTDCSRLRRLSAARFDRSSSPSSHRLGVGGALRWGGGLLFTSDVLSRSLTHCHHLGQGCHANFF